jgi:Family of unknown function (DUF5675)
MELLLQRADNVTRGALKINGVFFCYTLERPADDPEHPRIKAGTYRVRLTVSGRAQRGTLWTPDADKRLPEVLNVPGRTGIRIHAANEVHELEGCVAVAFDRIGNTLLHSRLALEALMGKITDPCYLTIEDPSAEAAA